MKADKDIGTVYIQPKKLFKRVYYTKMGDTPKAKIAPKPISKAAARKRKKVFSNSMVILIITTLTILTVILPLVFLKVRKLTIPQVSYPSPVYLADLDSNLREDFYKKLSINEQNQMENDLMFVQSIIKSIKTRKKLDVEKLALAIVLESKRANVDPLFVSSIILQESGFKTHAKSPVGALGLMQIMPATAKYIDKKENVEWPIEKDLTNPVYNIRLGIVYVKYLQRMYKGDMHKVLMAYNWGPGNVNKYIKRVKSAPKDVVRYSKNIQYRHKSWKKMSSARI